MTVRLLPRTLVGRSLLLVVVLVLLGELVALVVYTRLVVRPRTEPFMVLARQQVDAVSLAWAALPPEGRAGYARALAEQGGARVLDAAEALPPLAPPRRPAITALMEDLRARLPDGYRVGWQPEAQRLWVGVPRSGAPPLWIGLPARDLGPRFSGVGLVAIAGGGLLALVGAYLLQRRIDRPLRDLAEAARAIGAGRPVDPLPETGPEEIAAVARALNGLARDLDAADRERAVMLAGVSHDLRTPLAKIRLALELIGPAAEPALREQIERSVASADRVIDQFVVFGRAGGDEEAVPTDLDALVRAAVAEAGAPEGALRFEGGAPPPLPLRPQAMRRLVANLLDNALKYGAPPVVVRTAAGRAGVTVSVSDAGAGVADEDVERLKRPFVRASAARAAVPGAGLGLAIVERITRLHGGRFDLLAADPAAPAGRRGLTAKVALPLPVRQTNGR